MLDEDFMKEWWERSLIFLAKNHDPPLISEMNYITKELRKH